MTVNKETITQNKITSTGGVPQNKIKRQHNTIYMYTLLA